MNRTIVTIAAAATFSGCFSANTEVDKLLSSTTSTSSADPGNSAISFTPSVHDFGNLQTNTNTSSKVITVTNTNPKSVTISSVTASGSGYSLVGTDCTGASLTQSSTCTATVQFAPTVGGSSAGTLTVSYVVSGSTAGLLSTSASLLGTGVAPLSFAGITSATVPGCAGVTANWATAAGAVNYLVYDVTSNPRRILGTSSTGTSSVRVYGLTPGTSYTLKVEATDLFGVTTATTATASTTTLATTLTGYYDAGFPSSGVTQGSATSVAFSTYLGQDTSSTTYTCVYDQVIDGAVAAGTNCTSLPGTASFNTSTGALSWTPSLTAWGPYEIKVTSTLGGVQCSDVSVVDVVDNVSRSNEIAYWDAQFATAVRPGSNSPLTSTWKNLSSTGSTYDGTLSGNSWTTGWTGSSSASTPRSLAFDGAVPNTVTVGSNLGGNTDIAFGAWVKPSDVTQTRRSILTTGGGTGSGLVLRQGSSSGLFEFVVGADGTYSSIASGMTPVAYWKLDEAAGATVTDQMGSYNGTYTGATLNQGGALSVTGSSVRFTGAGSYINVPDAAGLQISGSLSLAAWVYPESTANYRGIIAKGNGVPNYGYLWAFDSGTLFSTLYLDGANNSWSNRATTAATLNQWNHLAVTFDATTKSLTYYVNGSPAGSYTTAGNTISTNTAVLELGTMINNGYPLTGRMDEAMVFNRAITAQEVAKLYAGTKGCVTSTTVSNGGWVFLGGIYNGTSGQLDVYLNGANQCSTTLAAGAFTAGASNLTLGAESDGSKAWSGSIGELRLYTTATSTTLQDLFHGTGQKYIPATSPPTNGLVLKLDAAANNGTSWVGNQCSPTSWVDLSASAFTGTLVNFNTCDATKGWNGSGVYTDPYRLAFKGTSSTEVTVPDNASLQFTSDFSFYTFIRNKSPTTAGTYNGLIAKGNAATNYNYMWVLIDGQKQSLYSQGANAAWTNTSSTALPQNKWSAIAVTYKAATKTLTYYLNGTADGSYTTAGGSPTASTHALEIGSMIDNAYPFTGDMGVSLIYNRELTATEVKQICQAYQLRFNDFACPP